MKEFFKLQPSARATTRHAWWLRPGLTFDADDNLVIAGRRAVDIARQYGTTTFVYDLDRVEDNFMRLHTAFEGLDHPFQVFYAMKANRFAPILYTLRDTGLAGIDTASPGEVHAALAHGFAEEKITFTNVSVSRKDVERLKGLNILLNCDSISMIHKVADADPGRDIGIRINPQVGVGYNDNLTYAGQRPTKFGIYLDRLAETLETITDRGLRLRGLHMHVGCGWTGSAITQYFQAVDRLIGIAKDVIQTHGPIEYINFGGGLGVPLRDGDAQVDISLYTRGIIERVRQLGPGIRVCIEPGDYMVKDTGTMLTEVTMVEEKGGVQFVGVDTGFNVHTGASHYNLFQEFVHAQRATAPFAGPVTIVGNINEVIDVFAQDRMMPRIDESDLLAMLNAGGYGTSMTMLHCLREPAQEIALTQRGNPHATA